MQGRTWKSSKSSLTEPREVNTKTHTISTDIIPNAFPRRIVLAIAFAIFMRLRLRPSILVLFQKQAKRAKIFGAIVLCYFKKITIWRESIAHRVPLGVDGKQLSMTLFRDVQVSQDVAYAFSPSPYDGGPQQTYQQLLTPAQSWENPPHVYVDRFFCLPESLTKKQASERGLGWLHLPLHD